jgi:hypothetical protein
MATRLVPRRGAYRVGGTFSEYLAAAGEGQADVVEDRPVGSMDDGGEDLEGLEREAAAAEAAEAGEEGEEGEAGGNGASASTPTRPPPSPQNGKKISPGTPPPPSTGKSPNKGWSVVRRSATAPAAVPAKKESKPRKVTARCWLAEGQGLTLVHFSAQFEPCLTQEDTRHTPNAPLTRATQPVRATPIPYKALKLS